MHPFASSGGLSHAPFGGLGIRSGRYCIGDPDDCIRYLEAYAEAGVDEVIPLFQVGGIFHEEVMDTLRLFGKHVIPHFNAKASSSSGSPAR